MLNTCVRCGIVVVPEKCTHTNLCKICSSQRKKDLGIDEEKIGVPAILGYTVLPNIGKTLNSRINELGRRAIIPGSLKEDGTYFVGRRSDGGKIEEREPNYK